MIQDFEAVLFDWGGTLMKEFSEYKGPMARWPVVEAIDGAEEALKSLQGKVRLGVLTNAEESGAKLVGEALERVGLNGYFGVILTPKESSFRKPSPEFFWQALKALDATSEKAVMVGDSYPGDVLGAKAAGMKAVWLNREGILLDETHPAYDAEISSLFDLYEALEKMRLPDISTCERLLAEYHAPENLMRHAQAVAGAAYRLAAWLRLRGIKIDPLLAHRGGYLHDLDKIACRETGKAHGEMSSEILTDMGWPELGEIARRHLMFKLEVEGEMEPSWEQKVVFYADKLVEGSQLVPVQIRLMALRERYPGFAERIKRSEPKVLRLEEEICGAIGKRPVEVLEELRGRVEQ